MAHVLIPHMHTIIHPTVDVVKQCLTLVSGNCSREYVRGLGPCRGLSLHGSSSNAPKLVGCSMKATGRLGF